LGPVPRDREPVVGDVVAESVGLWIVHPIGKADALLFEFILDAIAEINRKAHSTGISAIADRWSQLSRVASPARSNTVHEGYQRTIMPNKNRKIFSQKNHLTQIALVESSGVEIQASDKKLWRQTRQRAIRDDHQAFLIGDLVGKCAKGRLIIRYAS
jgi:hypothetical protein